MKAPYHSSVEERDLAETREALAAARNQVAEEIKRRVQTEKQFERVFADQRSELRKQLHDGLGQVLTSISFLATGLKLKLQQNGLTDTTELDEIMSLVNQAINESRKLAARCDAPAVTAAGARP